MINGIGYTGEMKSFFQDFKIRGQREGTKLRFQNTGLDQHESEIKSKAEGFLNQEQQRFNNALLNISQKACSAKQRVSELQASLSNLSSDSITSEIETEFALHKTELTRAAEERVHTETDLRFFKAENEIYGVCSYPVVLVWHLGLLAIIGLLEIFVNATFFENSSQGFLGGIALAISIAALNIGVATSLGYFFRYKNLRGRRLFGWSTLVIFLLFTIFCNALFAAYRSEYQIIVDTTDPIQIGKAFEHAFANVLALHPFRDFSSFILFCIGIPLSSFAFYKGYTLDDKYPGHGEKARRHAEAVKRELELHDKVKREVQTVYNKKRSSIQSVIQEFISQSGELIRERTLLQSVRSTFEHQFKIISRDYEQLIETYRNANCSVKLLPAPVHFKLPPPELTKPDLDISVIDNNFLEVQQELKRFDELHRNDLNTRLKVLQDNLTKLLNITFSSYLQKVNEDAEYSLSKIKG